MKLEKSLIELKYLSDRMCLKVPEHLTFSIAEYAKVVFGLTSACLPEKDKPFIVSCYSRSLFPRIYEETCLIADVHYVEYLADFSHWYRTKDNTLLRSIFCKYKQNGNLYYNKYVDATFYEWVIREKGCALPRFSAEDYQEGFLINIIALMHEIFHFVKGFEEYDALFREHDIDKYVQNEEESIREGKCDYMGLLVLLDKGLGLKQTQEEFAEKYFLQMAANCLYESIVTSGSGLEYASPVQGFMDRVIATNSFLYGMKKLVPNLDMSQVSLDSFDEIKKGLQYIEDYVLEDMKKYAREFNSLPESYRQNLYNEVTNREKKLRKQREFSIYPNNPD